MPTLIDSCKLCHGMQLWPRGLCRSCHSHFLDGPLVFRGEKGLDIFSLVHYEPVVQPLIKLCKMKNQARLVSEMGCLLARKISYELLEPVCGVIPMPARIFGDTDHAYGIAEAVAEHFDAPLTNHFLERTSAQAQKEKSVAERERAQVGLRGDFPLSAFGKTGLWLLVDDVVTSGATLLAAWTALGKPPAVAITLASTPKYQTQFIAG